MPLFRASGGSKARSGKGRVTKMKWTGNCGKLDEDGSVPLLTHLCLLSLADNMKEVWAKDYAENYLDQYTFRHIMGPFNLLPGELVEELTWLLCTRKQLTRAALHLLLVPQLRRLSLDKCPGLVTSTLCTHIAARCQGLLNLDLSGAQQLLSKALCETLCCLPALRSLSVAGTPCDRCVIRTIAGHCRLLRHLDVSCCHLLSPAALLPLGGTFCSSSTSPSAPSFCCTSTSKSSVSSCTPDHSSSFSVPLSPLPLSSLLALDIGFGEQEEDPVAAAAYLLLSLPVLEKVAMEGITQACSLIDHREFSRTDEFSNREGVLRLKEVWEETRRRQNIDGWRKKREGAAAVEEEHEEDEEEEEARIMWEGYESEEDTSRDEGPSCSLKHPEEKTKGRIWSQSGDENMILRLKDIRGATCDSLDSLGRLCPEINSISVNINYDDTRGRSQGSVLAEGLQPWSGQMQNISVHSPGPLVDLLPALQVAGSSLVSLALEGVKTSPHSPLLEIIKACPRLRDLVISAEPPTMPQEEEEEAEEEEVELDRLNDLDLPQLPNLCSLTLNFSYNHDQMKPVMSWMSLRKVVKCLLTGSPLLRKLSLVSLPCPLNCVLQDVLCRANSAPPPSAYTDNLPLVPLGRVQHIDLLRTDVKMITVKNIMQQSRRLKFVNLSYCWKISKLEWLDCKTLSDVQVVWV